MKYKAEIDVMPNENLLDPQGKAVSANMKNVGLPQIDNVRIGRHITLSVEAGSEDEAKGLVEDACKKILANEIMESFTFEVSES